MPLTWWIIERTRFGLRLRAVGELSHAFKTAQQTYQSFVDVLMIAPKGPGHIVRRQSGSPLILTRPGPLGRPRATSARIAPQASTGGDTESSPRGSAPTTPRYCSNKLAHVMHVAT